MSKFTTTLKGLMALTLGSFALSASAADDYTSVLTVENATSITDIPGVDDNRSIYIIQTQKRGGVYADTELMQLTHCGSIDGASVFDGSKYHTDVAANGTSVNQQFAIITYGDKKYLYSVGGEGLVSRENLTNQKCRALINTTTSANAGVVMSTSTDNGVTYFRFGIDGGYMLNCSGYHEANRLKGVMIDTYVTADGGNRFNLQKLNDVQLTDEQYNTALGIIQGNLAAAKTAANERLADIKEFYHAPSTIEGYIAQVNAAVTESQVTEIVNGVYDDLNGKLVYLLYAPRENETDYKYLGVLGKGNYRIAQLLPQRGTRAKWQLQRVSGEYRFRLRNIASDTHITDRNDGQTANDDSYYEFEFKNNTSTTRGVSLKSFNSDCCLTVGEQTVGGTTYQYVLTHSEVNNDADILNIPANAWKVEPVGIDALQLGDVPSEGQYVVIRSNRGLTNDAITGSLLGCYTPDRVKARDNASFQTGVHMRQYMNGMHTIWKIVPQNDGGFKIYSLMGEGENHTPLFGMHYEGQEGYISITDDPTTVYIRPITQWDFTNRLTSPIPNGMALCSDASNVTAAKNCFDVNNFQYGGDLYDDTFVRANAYRPNGDNKKNDLGSVFYIERVSDYDVEKAKEAFMDYAQRNRMFELLKNVLTDEEEAYALAQKTIDTSTTSINSVADARVYLEEGTQAASTRAFEKLDGKVIRLRNRMGNGDFFMNHDSSLEYLQTDNSNADNGLDKLWVVEVVSPELRQLRLKNYMSGKYIQPMRTDNAAITMVDNADDAGTYTVTRYYSLDGESFYANLSAKSGTTTMAIRALNTSMNNQKQLMRGASSALGCHWTLEDAVADDVKNTEVTLNYDKENKVIVVSGPALEKTANFPAAYGVTLTPAAATAALDGEAATPVEVAVPNDKITKDGETFKVDLSELNVTPSNYTLNFPVGYFTINNKLAPALSTAVTVSEPTGIKEVNAAEKGAEVIYDLQGRRVSKAGKGVYIINGEKTLVK